MDIADQIAFLIARLGEDEAAALKSKNAPEGAMRFVDADQWSQDLVWLADEARVLREVEAKRAIIKRFGLACTIPYPVVSFTAGQDDGYRQACMDAIGDLAAIYSDHPDYPVTKEG